MDGKLLKNQEGVRTSLESVQKSCRNLTDLHILLHILFKEYRETLGLRTLTETQKSHRTWGGDCHPLFVLGILTKGFREFTQQKIKETIAQ